VISKSATAGLALVVLSTAAMTVHAQAYPAKPIRLIVPFPPGGGTDLVARAIAPKLMETGGIQLLIDNRAGGGTVLGAELAARSAPDGYTIFLGTNTSHAINPTLLPKLPYDALKDFAPITRIALIPYILVVHPSLPARSVKELVALAKARPGELNFASSGSGTPGHLAGIMLNEAAGINMVHIPYKGAAPAVTDLMAGRVHLMFDNLASALPNVKAGKLRALAVTTLQRSTFLPDLPTLDEAGLKGFDMTTWWGIMAPAKTPDAVVQRLNAEIFKALELPDVKERLRAIGSETPAVRTPGAFSAFVAAELKTYGELVKRSGAKPD